MAYRLPTFNMSAAVTVYSLPDGEVVANFETVCQVRGLSRSESLAFHPNDFNDVYGQIIIKFPPGTAVYAPDPDGMLTEVYVGDDDATGYRLYAVWDVAVGFSNEYRAALGRRFTPLHGQ